MSDSKWAARHVISSHAELVDVGGQKSIKTTFRIDSPSNVSGETLNSDEIREERAKLADLYFDSLEVAASSRSTQWIREYDLQPGDDADFAVIMKEWNHCLNITTGTLCSGTGYVKVSNTKGSTIKPGSFLHGVDSASHEERIVGEGTFPIFGKGTNYATILDWREMGLDVMKQTRKELDLDHSKDVADCMLYSPSIPQQGRAPYLAVTTVEEAYGDLVDKGFQPGRNLLLI